MASLASFIQTVQSRTGEPVNALHESLSRFNQLCEIKELQKKPIVLLLNKMDIFKSRLEKECEQMGVTSVLRTWAGDDPKLLKLLPPDIGEPVPSGVQKPKRSLVQRNVLGELNNLELAKVFFRKVFLQQPERWVVT